MPLNDKTRKLADKLENEKEQIMHSTEEMSAELKRLLESEIDAFKKREKHRSTEMLAIFARHNFYANGFTPRELRTTLEDLGPTYVKIGQIMSSRVDLLPKEYCRELEKLRDSVKPLDPAVAKAVIEQETGKKIDEIYSEFRDEPLGSASIAQAHYGVLKDGTRVVTKVQRPLIAGMMRKDLALLSKLADLVNVIEEDSDEQVIDFKSVIAEIEHVTKAELDFRVEAENTRLFREKCLDDEENISCPAVIDDLTTERIFTMTYIDGCSVADTEKLAAEGCDPDAIGRALVDSYLHQVLDVGIFHADPHQGNILVSHGKPYWIDFGMIGRVTDKDIDLIQEMVKALVIHDADALVNAVMSMGAASEKTDRARLTRDAELFIEKYMNVKSVSDINVTEVFDEVMGLAAKNHVSMPGRFTMLARSLTTMEGVVEQLCPDLNIFDMLYDKLKTRARQKMDIPRELLEKGSELVKAGRKTARIPLLFSEVLEGMAKGKTRVRVELSEYEEPLERIFHFLRYTVLTLVALVLFIGSCILCTTDFKPLLANGMPLPAVAGIVFSIALTIFSIKRLK
ncbi:MAG: AarF/ABC1/UbiB kinase family protein [Clostridia bacterium]|nr:AarF/ABC1/UbiB kinase family protein [Clostridia bacterium]